MRTSLWLVGLPGILLAALGARAVFAEIDAARSAAGDRAQAAAARLARSTDRLLDDFIAALPAPEPPRDAAARLRELEHLSPRWLLSPDGRAIDPAPRAPTAAETALAEDALATAGRMVGDGAPEEAAALLAGALAVIESPGPRAELRLRALEIGPRLDPREELAELREVAAAASEAGIAEEGILARAFERALDLLPDAERLDWIVDAYRRLAEKSSDHTVLLARAQERLADSLPADARATRELFTVARSLAGDAAAVPTVRRLVVTADGVRFVVCRAVAVSGSQGVVTATAGGAIPVAAVVVRITTEADALVDDGEVAAIRLVGADGVVVAASARPDVPPAAEVRTAAVSDFRSGLRVEALSVPATGVPGTAVLLAVAAAATTLALLAGAVALQRAAERQARLAEERQRFLDHVAHEVRTPTGAILALTQELSSGHVPTERRALYDTHLRAEAERLASLVEETLDLTRLDAGRLAFRPEPCDLRAVVEDAVRASAVRCAGAGGPSVETSLPDRAVPVRVDPGAMRRTVRNLVDNAVLHGGGDEPVRVTLQGSGGVARVEVRDAGRGIAADQLGQVFERFHRVPAETHEIKGVGLGLALCREVARAHGGDVTVTSTPGAGSTFTLSLPLDTTEEPHG